MSARVAVFSICSSIHMTGIVLGDLVRGACVLQLAVSQLSTRLFSLSVTSDMSIRWQLAGRLVARVPCTKWSRSPLLYAAISAIVLQRPCTIGSELDAQPVCLDPVCQKEKRTGIGAHGAEGAHGAVRGDQTIDPALGSERVWKTSQTEKAETLGLCVSSLVSFLGVPFLVLVWPVGSGCSLAGPWRFWLRRVFLFPGLVPWVFHGDVWSGSVHPTSQEIQVAPTQVPGCHSGGNSYRPENFLAEFISLLSYCPASPVERVIVQCVVSLSFLAIQCTHSALSMRDPLLGLGT